MTYHARSLECHGGKSPMDQSELHAMARKAWHEHGILTVNPEVVESWADRQHLVNIATKIYGKRADQ